MRLIVLGTLLSFLAPAAVPAQEADLTIEDFLQGLSTIPGVVVRKDPFIQATPPFEAPRPDGSALSLPVLERYPITSYSVVAVLLGEQYPRALIRLPSTENNKVVIVKLRDALGNKGGKIIKISKEGVTVLQNQRSPLGFVDKAEVVVPFAEKKARP